MDKVSRTNQIIPTDKRASKPARLGLAAISILVILTPCFLWASVGVKIYADANRYFRAYTPAATVTVLDNDTGQPIDKPQAKLFWAAYYDETSYPFPGEETTGPWLYAARFYKSAQVGTIVIPQRWRALQRYERGTTVYAAFANMFNREQPGWVDIMVFAPGYEIKVISGSESTKYTGDNMRGVELAIRTKGLHGTPTPGHKVEVKIRLKKLTTDEAFAWTITRLASMTGDNYFGTSFTPDKLPNTDYFPYQDAYGRLMLAAYPEGPASEKLKEDIKTNNDLASQLLYVCKRIESQSNTEAVAAQKWEAALSELNSQTAASVNNELSRSAKP
jgi:hypothetical protein